MALTDNIVAYWKFDENAGTTAADATGNGWTLALNDSPSWGTNEIVLNGTSQYGSNAGNFGLSTAFTFACRVKRSATGSFQDIIRLGDPADLFFRFTDTDKIELYKSTTRPDLISAGTITDTTGHHHVAATFDGTTVKLYIDGSADANTAVNSTAVSAAAGIAVGRRQDAASEFFSGNIGYFGVWSRALTSIEISTIYNSGSVLQYPFTSSRALFMPPNFTLGAGGAFFPNPLT